jgi:hypothetical protein
MSDLFRKKSLERVSSPEQLDDYIRVTTPSVWLILLALVILLTGLLVYSIFGTVEGHSSDGTSVSMHPITLVTN